MEKKKRNTNLAGFVIAALCIVMAAAVITDQLNLRKQLSEPAKVQSDNEQAPLYRGDSYEERTQEDESSSQPKAPQSTKSSQANENETAAQENAKSDEEQQARQKSEEVKDVGASGIKLSPVLNKMKVSLPFSYNKEAVYSPTLDSYRSDHTGCDYEAKIGSNVMCAYEGVVEKVYEDERYGLSVAVSHDGGLMSVYSNLEHSPFVKAGDKLKAGDIIGKVGSSAGYEIDDGEHLHLEICLNGEYMDPQEYF